MAALKAVDHHGRSRAAGLRGASACGSGHSMALPAARLLGKSVTISAPPPAARAVRPPFRRLFRPAWFYFRDHPLAQGDSHVT